jgi:toxin ParE1/3/4
MARLRWSPQAAADLGGICEFIAQDSEQYARALARRLVDTVEAIPDHPKAGRLAPELGDPLLREKIVGNYRIIYRLRADVVEIVTIIHGAQLLDRGRLGET